MQKGAVLGNRAAVEPQIGVLAVLRYLFCGGFAGVLAGILFLGAGARIVMRISALLDPEAAGTITENGNVIGEITAGGSLGLVLFEGLFGGLMAGLCWVLVREWFPQKSWPRLALAGVTAALLGSFLVVSAQNQDFQALNPPVVNVAMFIAIVAMTGCGAAALDRPLQSLLPRGSKASILLAVLAVVGGLMAVSLLAQAYLAEDFCGCSDPPRPALAFLALAGVASVLSWRNGMRYGALEEPKPRWLRTMGVIGVAGACLFAGLDLVDEVRRIL